MLLMRPESLKLACVSIFICTLLPFVIGNIPTGTRKPKKFVVNLDLPQEQRWDHVVEHYVGQIESIILAFRTIIPDASIVFPLVEKIGSDIEKYIPAPYAKEMKGIARKMNVNIGDIVLSNLMYDVTALCTSIVSQDTKGRVWHARNLDFPVFSYLKNLTIDVEFQKNGKTVYSAVTFAGYVGILTGQRPHGFTISVDRRVRASTLGLLRGKQEVTEEGVALMNLLVSLFHKSVVPVSFLVRDALAKSTNYNAAVTLLGYSHTAAPVYFIIGGVRPGEAAVITKDRLKPHDIWTINPVKGRWFEVETNYDHWKPPPPEDKRRDIAIKAMEATGRNNIGVQSLYNVMSTHAILNHQTVYTVVMSAAQPKSIHVWIRH